MKNDQRNKTLGVQNSRAKGKIQQEREKRVGGEKILGMQSKEKGLQNLKVDPIMDLLLW